MDKAQREKEIGPILKLVSQIVRQNVQAESCRILLFGSWATLEALPTSDIDIALEGDTPLDMRTIASIREEIDHLPTLRKVELLDLWEVDDRFREKVLQQAEVLA